MRLRADMVIRGRPTLALALLVLGAAPIPSAPTPEGNADAHANANADADADADVDTDVDTEADSDAEIDEPEAPKFRMANKVAEWEVRPGEPRLVAFLDNRSEQIGRGPLILLYDQPVSPRHLRKALRAEDDKGEALELRVWRPKHPESISGLKLDPKFAIAVRLTQRPPVGTEVRLHYPTWISGGEEILVKALKVSGPLVIEATNIPDSSWRASINAAWQLQLSNPVSHRALLEHLTIEPKPKSLQVDGFDQVYQINAELEPGTRYHVRISDRFGDLNGQRLEGGFSRVFKTQDLPPDLQLPGAPLYVERARPHLPIRIRNAGKLHGRMMRFDSAERFIAAIAERSCPAGGESFAIADISSPMNQTTEARIRLPGQGKSLLGCVEITAQGRGSRGSEAHAPKMTLVQLSDLGVTAKIGDGKIFTWVTRLSDAHAVKNADVTLFDAKGRVVSRARTDGTGIATIEAPSIADRRGLKSAAYLSARIADDQVVAHLDPTNTAQPWQFGLPGTVADAARLNASVFTDRGVYRPGEKVQIKMIVRDPNSHQVSENRALKVSVRDPRSKVLVDRAVTLDAYGTAHLEVEIGERGAVGSYAVTVTQNDASLTKNFRVEAYRVPTFEVKVSSHEARAWVRGQNGKASIEARYLHGGPLAAREVEYQVLRSPVPFTPAGLPGYVFSRSHDAQNLAGSVKGSTEKLDGQGRIGVDFPVDFPTDAGAMRYVVQAAVTDVDRQVYAGRLSMLVHPAEVYVGVKPPPAMILAAGDSLEVPIVVVDTAGHPKAGVTVRAALKRIDHHTAARLGPRVQRLNHAVVKDTADCQVVTKLSGATCRFVIPVAGSFRLLAEAKDETGAEVASGFDFEAAGDNTVAWPRFAHERIELVVDRPRYEPGDVAKIMVQTPFDEAEGLLTIERGGVLLHRHFKINRDAPALLVPIEAEYAPNIFVSVVLLRGRVHGRRDATGYETGAPAFRIGYANLTVQPREHRMQVSVRPEVDVAQPGAKVAVTVELRDANGRPRPGQVTLMAVDEAVLGLTAFKTPDPIVDLFLPRPLGVRTGESRLDMPGSVRERREALFPAGDGGEGFSLSDFPAEIRTLFRSTAHYDPAVDVDATGRRTVHIELPDNTTTYRLMAVAVDKTSKSGSGEARLVVKKPLLVQPSLPRFVYHGDTFMLEAQVFNGTSVADNAHLTVGFDGLELQGDGGASERQGVEANRSTRFVFPVRVTGHEHAKIRFGAVMGAHTDAVEVELPILSPGTKKSLLVSTHVDGEGKLAVTFPENRFAKTEEIELLVSKTQLTELRGAVDYVMGYPYGCIEQTTSRAYPLVMLKDLLPSIGVEVDAAKLEEYTLAGLKRILSFQTRSGGLSYWPGGTEPHAFATAFGLTALIAAKQRGYEVPDERLAEMATYLESALRRDEIREDIPHGGIADADSRAFFVMTLGRLGRQQSSQISVLWQNKAKLTPFGLSFLAIAVAENPSDKSLLAPILAELRKSLTETADEAYYAAGDRRGGWSFDSPLRSHASALLAYASGSRADPMSNKLLQGLLARRAGGLWGNTQENVFGIMGVATLVQGPTSATGVVTDGPGALGSRAGSRAPTDDSTASAEGADDEVTVTLNGRRLPRSALTTMSSVTKKLVLSASDLHLPEGRTSTQEFAIRGSGRGRGREPLNVTVRAVFETQLDNETRRAAAHGFTVRREVESLHGQRRDETIPLGEVVRVRLFIEADRSQHYVAIDDLLPAGLEPLNANLATTEQVEAGSLSAVAQASLQALSYQEIRDSRVSFFIDEMRAGHYELSYLARATTPGRFLRPGARAEAMYESEINGRSETDEVVVR